MEGFAEADKEPTEPASEAEDGDLGANWTGPVCPPWGFSELCTLMASGSLSAALLLTQFHRRG